MPNNSSPSRTTANNGQQASIKLGAQRILAVLALLAVGGFVLALSGCGSKPPRANVESMFADYLEQTRGAMGNSHNLSSAKDVMAKVMGMAARDAGFGHIKAIEITNEYKRTVDGESRYYYEADISTYYGDQFIADSGSVANLTVWRGSISCVKRGKEWYWYAEALPERVQKKPSLSTDEQKRLKTIQEFVNQVEGYKAKALEKLASANSKQEILLVKGINEFFPSQYAPLPRDASGQPIKVKRVEEIRGEILVACDQKLNRIADAERNAKTTAEQGE